MSAENQTEVVAAKEASTNPDPAERMGGSLDPTQREKKIESTSVSLDNEAGTGTGSTSNPSFKIGSSGTAQNASTPAGYGDNSLYNYYDDDSSDYSGLKRPRLRLAHACDRCRRRKIRCDTQQPCGPCQHTGNQCTFETPSKRILKHQQQVAAGAGHGASSSGAGGNASGSATAGPSAPRRNSKRDNSQSHSSGKTDLEARLENLEALLRNVPPHVHAAMMNSLDSHLKTSATGETGGPFGSGSSTRRLSETSEDDAINDIERSLGTLNLSNGYLYLDEIGQTKWQGATSGFPLLDLLTAESDKTAGGDAPSQGDINGSSDPSPVSGLHSDSRNSGAVSNASPDPTSLVSPTFSSLLMPGTGEDDGSPSSTASRERRSQRFFPGRAPRPSQMLNPEATWRLITNVIPSDLMDTLVRCYLSTSHLLWPFLHVPSFLEDYANPQKWSEPGFACFVVAVCTLSSRHVDDPRVRAKFEDPSTAGKQYFELFKRLRDLPSADRPTLYSIQAAFLAAIYAFGLGTLSKAFSLLAESVTLCLEGGLHRSVEGYEYFTPIEAEMRKVRWQFRLVLMTEADSQSCRGHMQRTFWSIYSWDKQSAALFGRPPIIHLRDCDVPEPLQVDDEYITKDSVLAQPPGTQTRLSAFVAVIRLHVVLEGVIDACVTPSSFASSEFLSHAAKTIAKRSQNVIPLLEEEALLEEWVSILPSHWHYDANTAESKDPIRITQAERLHCLEHLVRMIIYRQRFSGYVQMPPNTDDEKQRFFDYCKKAMESALSICANHVHISQRGMMTYYGVHVIHQLAQAGRTLVAVILNCKTPKFETLSKPATEGLKSCVGLLRRFSGRYVCGLRSAEILVEWARVCNIPVDLPPGLIGNGRPSPAWLRPVQKRHSPSPVSRERRSGRSRPITRVSPAASSPSSIPFQPLGSQMGSIMGSGAMANLGSGSTPRGTAQDYQDLSALFADALDNPASANALLSTQDFFDLSAAASPSIASKEPNPSMDTLNVAASELNGNGASGVEGNINTGGSIFDSLAPASAPFDVLESLDSDQVMMDSLGDRSWDVPFASGNDALSQMSASTILSLMQAGTFSTNFGSSG